jgi:hypothetical protein
MEKRLITASDGLYGPEAGMRQAPNASGSKTSERQLNLERDMQRRPGNTPDFAEGINRCLPFAAPRAGHHMDEVFAAAKFAYPYHRKVLFLGLLK